MKKLSNISEDLQLIEIGHRFYTRGWALGTSGNFSTVVSRDPLRMAITMSGVEKGRLSSDMIIQIDDQANVISGSGKPSDETLLHLALVQAKSAGAVLHTHSVWSTMLSKLYSSIGYLKIEDFEMLKGLSGIKTHQHCEYLPIIDNSQNMIELSKTMLDRLSENPNAHGVLIEGHGLYTWGKDLKEAERHVEILEFLLEVKGRLLSIPLENISLTKK